MTITASDVSDAFLEQVAQRLMVDTIADAYAKLERWEQQDALSDWQAQALLKIVMYTLWIEVCRDDSTIPEPAE